jgi:deoxyribodipyrimidine photo-lyase
MRPCDHNGRLMRCSLLWFRRDLRLVDLPALEAAQAAGAVVPVFIVDPLFTRRAGLPRLAYMARALRSLDEQLGGTLVYRHGDPAEQIVRLAREVGAVDVFVSRDFGSYGRRRDGEVARRLAADGRCLHGVGSPYAVEPGTVTKQDGSPYSVFTPFARSWLASGALRWGARPHLAAAAVDWVGAPDVACDGPPVEPLIEASLPTAHHAEVHARWEGFVDTALDSYEHGRDRPAIDGTSQLSAAIRWGLVHPRTLIDHLAPNASHDRFRTELAWRDFYADVLFHRPDTAWENLQPKMNSMPVDTDARAVRRFEAWCTGTTGYPFVDAGMRQLLSTGWMHNRVRMVVASFLVKDLHLPWQWGARHFLRHLVDGDVASNNHGWQWVAGSGTDAAPYFRVFNPTAQSARFDPDGEYIRRWVPELEGVTAAAVHMPGSRRPDAYPAPMVDHAIERDEALRRYRSVAAANR